jgi:Fic family protein
MQADPRPVYLWQQPGWPQLQVDTAALSGALQAARQRQGEALGLAQALGMPTIDAVLQELWVSEAAATAAIEGERLDLAALRSSVMRRLGQGGASGPVSRSVEGLVEVMQDALAGFDQPLDDDRLCRWQSALFPGGTSGIRRIAVGRYRDHADPMQIVSGRPGHEVVHYQAPASAEVPREMARFLSWFEATRPGRGAASSSRHAADGLTRAAIAHLWFETIHPFEDGNGRIGRAIADMALAQDLGAPTRLYSLSAQLLASRGAYYDALNQAQKGQTEVTAWVRWFADALAQACARTTGIMLSALHKQRFWAAHAATPLNERQRKVVQKLLDAGDGGFLGGLSADKYVKMTGTSKATATRDLAALLQHGLLRAQGSGKATRYQVNVPEWAHAGAG